MHEVLKYLNEHNERIALKDIAAYSGYSVWHFCEKFKAYTGQTYHEYVNKRVMQIAVKELLSGKGITELAFDLGYNSINGFKKAFCKEFGVYPSEYLKRENALIEDHHNRRHMTRELSDRCAMLKDEYINGDDCPQKIKIRGQRMYWFMKGYYDVPKDMRDNMRLCAYSLKSVIDNFRPYIFDNELIVGYDYDESEIETLGYRFRSESDIHAIKEYLEKGELGKEKIDELIACLKDKEDPYKSEYILNNFAVDFDSFDLTENEKAMIGERAVSGFCNSNNHTVIDYEKVLTKGFIGILSEVKEQREEHGSSEFYECLELVCSSASQIGRKYADRARQMLHHQSDERVIRELEDIAEVCTQVPEMPARTFREAVQSIYFTNIINVWEDSINANSLGRLDVLLYPYYTRDIENGSITPEQAFDLICCLWIKLYRQYDVRQCTIGGCDKDGNDSVNELSYMMLDAVELLDTVRCMSVRYDKNTKRAFLRRAFEVLRYAQKGIPTFFNDDVLIPALSMSGIALEDSRSYAVMGCVEPTLPGKSNSHSTTAHCNLLKAIEYALNRGCSMCSGGNIRHSVETPAPLSFKSFDDLLCAVKQHIRVMIDTACHIVNCYIPVMCRQAPLPLKSLLTDDCIKRGKDYNAGGSIYNYYQVMLAGFANLIDSLEAIRTLVFNDRIYTMEQLLNILRNNFPDEKVRRVFIERPAKYGNDVDSVDQLAINVYNYCCDCIATNKPVLGQSFHPQFYSYIDSFSYGSNVCATPDGRRKGDVLAYNICPASGYDINGYEAVLNSVSILPTYRAPGATSLTVDIDPYLFTEINIDRILDIFLSASNKGLCNTVFNIVDRDILIEAQNHPRKYPSLVVNVSAFSKQFVTLPKELQDDIINRTKHRTT